MGERRSNGRYGCARCAGAARTRLLVGASLALAVLGTPAASADAESWAQIIVEQTAANGAMPVLSTYDPLMDLDSAYEVQRALVLSRHGADGIGGYKAGFTAAGSGERFGLRGPIAGVLPAAGRLADGATLDRSHFGRLMVELEIGFVLRSPITREMRSVEDLLTYVRHAVPAVELPDLNYERMETLTGADVVATNVAAAHYIAGEPLSLGELDEVNTLSAALYRDGQRVDEGHATNAAGNQLEALLWLVNTVRLLGWPLEAGQLLLTGTLGRINAAEPGDYVADYGRARLAFRVVAGDVPAQARRP